MDRSYGRPTLEYLLFQAVGRGDLNKAESLIKRFGENFRNDPHQGYLLLYEAMVSKKLDVARFLLDKGAPVNTDKNRFTIHYGRYEEFPLQLALIHEDMELFKIILSKSSDVNDYGGENGETALHTAVRLNQLEAVKLLLEHKSDINSRDNFYRTPLLTSIEAGTDSLPMLQLLFEYQPDLSIRRSSQADYEDIQDDDSDCSDLIDVSGMDALSYATMLKRTDTIIYLLDHGADINSIDASDRTPLVIASMLGDEDTCRLLIDRGCDINKPAGRGETPLHHACANDHGKVVKLLLTRGSDFNANTVGWTPLHLIFYEPKVYNNSFPYQFQKCDNAFFELFDYGVDLNAQMKSDDLQKHKYVRRHGTFHGHGTSFYSEITPLHVALSTYKRYKDVLDPKFLELLLEYGADVNMLDDCQCSPLYTAVENNDLYLFSYLLCYGADVSQICEKGTPLSALRGVDIDLPFSPSRVMYQTAILWKVLGLATIPEEDMICIPPKVLSVLNTYEEKCKSELDNIRKFSSQLYLLLTKPINDITYLAGDRIIDDIRHKIVVGRFYLYHNIMYDRLERASFRFRLLEQCKDFNDWLEELVPHCCATLILSYLDNRDLRRLRNW